MVEFNCPVHGLERWNIKIVKKFNIPTDTILLKESRKGGIKSLVVGKDIPNTEIKAYIEGYFRERNLWQYILRMNLI